MPIPSSGSPYVDPRNVVTEDAFRVAPELLGTPLARPWRRGAAMLVDGLLIALLTNASGVLFGLTTAAVLFRVSAPRAGQGYVRRSFRLMLRLGGALALFVVALRLWDGATDRVTRLFEDEEPPAVARSEAGAPIRGVAGLLTAKEVLSFANASDEAEARERASRMVSMLRRSGQSDEEIRGILEEASGEIERPWLAAALDSALAEMGRGRPEAAAGPQVDSLAAAFAAAAGSGDTALAAVLRGQLTTALAADTVTRLRSELSAVSQERTRLARRLEEKEEEGPGILATMGSLAEDLGLGFGWSGLYFTALLAMWRGQTPGKRLMRIRVIRLDGGSIGWWAAFERFGGYAAGLVTGLLGFFQIYWDDNRQAVHDKICSTVVIQE